MRLSGGTAGSPGLHTRAKAFDQGIGFASRLESQASPYLGTNIDDYRRATPVDDGVWPPIAALSFNAYNLCTEIRQ
jgi:hypothetical protein